MVKTYKLLKKLTIILVIAALIFSIAFWIFNLYTTGDFAWEKIELQYMGETEVQLSSAKVKNRTAPYTIDVEQMKSMLNRIEDIDNPCCFEIRSEDDWEYVRNALEIDDVTIQLDFPNYYIVSFGWEIESLKHQKVRENSNEVTIGKVIKSQKSADCCPSTAYIYKMEKNVILRYISVD